MKMLPCVDENFFDFGIIGYLSTDGSGFHKLRPCPDYG
ncbi:MAG: hypothetical protein ACJAQ4_001720 [Cryomorphaceae bacterium]